MNETPPSTDAAKATKPVTGTAAAPTPPAPGPLVPIAVLAAEDKRKQQASETDGEESQGKAPKTKLSIEDIAKFAGAGVDAFVDSMGLKPRRPTELQLAAAVDGVRYRLTNPGASVEAQHASWVRARKEAGWKFGKVRSDAQKTHPNLAEFKRLDAVEQTRLKLFTGIVDALKGLLGAEGDPVLPTY